MSKFTQQHYETVAEIIYETERAIYTQPWPVGSSVPKATNTIMEMLRKQFSKEFRWDNESFKEDLFRRVSTFKATHRDGCRNAGRQDRAGHVCND